MSITLSAPMLESNFKKEVVRFLNKTYDQRIVIINYVNVRYAGVADLLVCLDGRFCAIELKVSTPISPSQQEFINKVAAARGVAFVLRYSPNWKDELTQRLGE